MVWGNPNIGAQGTVSYTVSELENNTKYFFQIRAGNGCKPGSFSNTLTAKPGVANTAIKRPNLSIYKQVLGEADKKEEKKIGGAIPPKENIAAATSTATSCAFSCYSWPLLAGEIVSLLVFFYFARKYPFIKPMYSILIPLSLYVFYLQLHGDCTPYKFFCRYYIPLNIFIYILILIVQKFKLLDKHSKVKKYSLH